MKKTLTIFILTIALLCAAHAAVVRLAPDFSWQGAGRNNSLRSLRGQPVVLMIAHSASDHAFRKQAKRLKEIYQDFAARNVIFVAAFQVDDGTIPTDVPFAIANNGAKIAADYQSGNDFNLVVIGADGNLDMQTSKIVPATRIRDVVINSFPAQVATRTDKK